MSKKKEAKIDSFRLAKNKKAAAKAKNIEGFGEEIGLRDAIGGETSEARASTSAKRGGGDGGDAARRKSRRTSRHHHGILNIDDFRQWTYSCGVFKIQKEYEVMVHEAHANGRSVEAEMKAQGFKDYNAFARSCKRFGLRCWPSELAELGSGFVLYYHLLASLAGLLLVVAFFKVPALIYYASFDSLDQWWFHDWQDAWSSSGSCECIGENRGIKGPNSAFQQSSYGTKCDTWDAAWCQHQSQPYSKPGRWCCRAWCFASPSCSSTVDASSPSLSNRHYQGMVRSVTTCTQNDVIAASQCGHLNDTAFAEVGVEESPEGYYISSSWLTPGNLGPNNGDEVFIMFMAALLTPIFHVFIAFMRSYQLTMEDLADSETTSPNDFAVMVKGLPSSATDEKSIEDFFRQHAVRGKMDTEIVKVVIGWDAQHFRDRMQEIQDCRKQLESIPDRYSEQAQAIQGRIKQITDEMAMQAGQQASELKSSGAAVVVFRHQHDMRACLQRWTSAWARHFYADADDIDWLPPKNGLKRGPPLPPFRTVKILRVERAANPGDINWMRLGVDKWERRKKLATSTLWMAVIIAVSFLISWGLNKLQSHVQESSQSSGHVQRYGFRFLSMAIGTSVSLINIMIRVFARYLGEEEFHDTHTDKEFSQALKMSVGMIINTSGIIFWLNTQPKSWYEKGGLVEDVFYVLFMDAIVAQFWMFLDLVYAGNYFERRKVNSAQLTDWNSTVASHYPARTDEDQEALQAVRVAILKFKQVFEPDECDNPHRYASALNSFICCIFYTPVCPLLPFVGLLGMICQYWVDKFLLLRWQKRPRPQNGNMARWSVKFLKTVAPLCITTSVFVFVTPSWKDKASCRSTFALSAVFSIVMIFVPLKFWRIILCQGCRDDRYEVEEDFEDYYNAQYMWPKEMKYHKDQFLYKALSDEKNPEMLEPEQVRTLNIDEMQGTFGTAVQHVAAITAYGNYNMMGMPGVSVAGYYDRGWGGAWFHETPGVCDYSSYGPAGRMAAVPSIAAPAAAPPAPVAAAAQPGYNPYQPAAASYGTPASYASWGTPAAAEPPASNPVSYASWGAPTAAEPPASPAPYAAVSPAGSYASWGTPPVAEPGQAAKGVGKGSAPGFAPGNGQFTPPSSGEWGQTGNTPVPSWCTGCPPGGTPAARPPAPPPAGVVWGAGPQTQATAYQWPARSYV